MAILGLAFFASLCAVCAIYWSLPPRARRLWLLAASYAFYCTFSLAHAALLLGATILAYVAAILIARSPTETRKRRVLTPAIVVFIGVLIAFKAIALKPSIGILLPLGISYYVFKIVSYVIDVYWEKIEAERDFISFATYVAFFPQISSGPIQRSGEFLAQLRDARPSADRAFRGFRLMLFGAFKKLVVADRLATLVDRAFADPHAAPSFALCAAGYLYAIQLYADLSGFTDLAIGMGRLFGIEAPQNFDRPFYAANVQQFWRRWHITLTSWLGDYLFTTLRFRLRAIGDAGLAIALLINMIAIGLWHGFKTTYLVFGVLNGVYMIVSALTLKRRDRFYRQYSFLENARKWAAPILTFHLMVIGFVFARAETIRAGAFIIARAPAAIAHALLHPGAARMELQSLGVAGDLGIALFGIFAMELAQHSREWLDRRPLALRFCAYYFAAVTIFFFGAPNAARFIYTQF